MPAHRDRQGETTENAKDIQSRRARGEVPCAECRRLKLKCDRQLPCSTCTRRGCESICPHGSLKTGSGTRLILADTEKLHAKLAEMSARIRALEGALMSMQTQHCPGKAHPLLDSRLLLVKSVLEPPEEEQAQTTTFVKEEELVDAFGALAITPDGGAQYFGRAASTEIIFLRAGEDSKRGKADEDAVAFLLEMGAVPPTTIQEVLRSSLPSYDRAWALCECYLESAAFYFRPIIREDLLDMVFAPIYTQDSPFYSASTHPHHLALVFFICAIGSLCDMDLPPRGPEAERYFQLGRLALSLRCVMDEATFETVMAMGFMTVYTLLAERATTMTPTHLGVTCLLAQNLGLHRDPARWGLSARTIDMRRRAFWELNSFDHVQSILTGWPAFFSSRNVDCPPPQDKDQTRNSDGSVHMGYWAWKIYCVQQALGTINVIMAGAKIPCQQAILKLDAKIRAEIVPADVRVFINAEPKPQDAESTRASVQASRLIYGEFIMLMYLHRAYFTQCVVDHPQNPQQSPYYPSYKATYEAAAGLVQLFRTWTPGHFQVCVRFPHYWSHVFSAVVIIGAAIIRGPNQPFAPSGLIDLAIAVSIFERAAESLDRARIALPYLKFVLRKAHSVYTEYLTSGTIQPDDDLQRMFGCGNAVYLQPQPNTSPDPSPSTSSTTSDPDQFVSMDETPAGSWQSSSIRSEERLNVFGFPQSIMFGAAPQLPEIDIVGHDSALTSPADGAAHVELEAAFWSTFPNPGLNMNPEVVAKAFGFR